MSAHSTPQKDHGASTPRAGVCTSYPPLRRSQGLQTSRVAALGRRAVQLKPTEMQGKGKQDCISATPYL